MSKTTLLLETHWMNGNCGTINFKNAAAGQSVKMRRVFDVLHLVGNLANLSKAVSTGANHSGALTIDTTDATKKWLLKYDCMQGLMDLVLLFNCPPINEVMFKWSGTAKEFNAGVNGMLTRLKAFSFTRYNEWLGRLKWQFA